MDVARRAAGHPVGILTNDLRAFHSEEWVQQIEIVGDVDVVVDGSLEGHLKPDPRLYELLSERLDVSFKEASRMKLLRLGSTLRIANEEIVRFTGGSAQFSARRLAFFLGRAWLLASAMRRAGCKAQ